MKLIVFCLFTVCCWTWMTAAKSDGTSQRKMLQESLRQLSSVKTRLQDSTQLLHTPPSNVTDCCCLPALQCFQLSLQERFNIFNTTNPINRVLRKMNRNLGSTVNTLNFCSSGEATSSCQECNSHPQENATEFFNRLESLIQRTIVRLSMD